MAAKKAVKKEAAAEAKKAATPETSVEKVVADSSDLWAVLNIMATSMAFLLRFWRIGHPDEVVFDEVHFGKFASHYLQREYYFDLHPPLAKLMFAGVGWLVGYDGTFKFENIGDNYTVNHVPYFLYRSLAATMGSLTVTIAFWILQSCGFSAYACLLGASLVLFDSAQVTQSRLILLDAALIFFMAASLLSYVRFRLQRHNPFGFRWWLWLSSTGFFLSCVISTKYVGLFTYLTIGVAVVADLWQLMDIRGKKPSQQLSLKCVLKHFSARLYALVVGPFMLYLFWFYVHFAVLTHSGPGNTHMSPEFQATLQENPMVKEALDVHFFDVVSIRGQNTDIYLHSHPHHYPLKYDDGRISSQGQQVTGYSFKEDPNSLWQILPPVPFEPEDQLKGAPVVGPQQVMLRHVGTDSYLLTHDVASPGFPTNEEFTTVSRDLAYGDRHQDTLFLLDIVSSNPNDMVRSKMTQFRLKHVNTNVAMWKADKVLPDWGYNQIEINGNKKVDAPGTVWYFDHIENANTPELQSARRTVSQGNVLPRRSFFTDYLELQMRMFKSNNMLTVTHPYMSSPAAWPMMTKGISFWSSKKDQGQIYLVGNHAAWYLINFALLAFMLFYVFGQLANLREFVWTTPYSLYKLNTTILWLFLAYALHYLPFYLMGRQLFLHHYLPAQVAGSLLVGALADFVCGQVDTVTSCYRQGQKIKYLTIAVVTVVFAGFLFWSPLVYGLHLSGQAIRNRQWFDIELQFNKGD